MRGGGDLRLRRAVAVVLAVLFAARGAAAGHLVEPVDIEAVFDEGREQRQGDIAALDAFLARPVTLEAARRMGVDVERLRARTGRLSTGELRDLAARAEALDTDPVAGGVVEGVGKVVLWTAGVILAALVLVILIVVIGCGLDDDCTLGD